MNRFVRSLSSIKSDLDHDYDYAPSLRSMSITDPDSEYSSSLVPCQSPLVADSFSLKKEEVHPPSNPAFDVADDVPQGFPCEQAEADLGTLVVWLYAFCLMTIDCLVLFVRLNLDCSCYFG